MKAINRPQRENDPAVRQMKQRIMLNIDKIIEAKAMIATSRIVAFACVAMYTEYGFGRKRIKKFYQTLLKEVSRQHDNMIDTGDDMLYKQLHEMDLDELAQDIQKSCDYYNLVVKTGFFEGVDDDS